MNTNGFPPAERVEADKTIRRSLKLLRRAESVVEALVNVSAASHATMYAEIATHRATLAHAGVFVSPAIEHALARAALRIRSSANFGRRSHNANPQRVLHIATEIRFPEGGHGRLLDRWIRSDRGRQHSLVMTRAKNEAPAFLHSSVAASGGVIHWLASGSSSFVERARHLRVLAADADAIVLHTHHYDALPILALSWPGRPPTILSNHAPHVFWLGRSVSDVVTCGRKVAKAICIERRGIPAKACFLLPLPVETNREPATLTRDDIRRELEVAPNEFLLLTIASEFKFQPAAGQDIVETIANVIARRAGVAWRIVGPTAQARWSDVANRTGGRIRAVGTRADLANLYSAADTFVDSYPFTSRTAMLDAAVAGLPLLAPRWHPREAQILSAWGGSVDSAILPFYDEASLEGHLDTLAQEATRQELGKIASTVVGEFTAGPNYEAMLKRVYELAAERTTLRNANGVAPHLRTPRRPIDDLDRYLQRVYSVTDVQRVLINWHRDETNWGAATTFPSDEAWLANTNGLASLIGEQDLIIRDFEALVAQLQNALATAQKELDKRHRDVLYPYIG